MLGSVLIANREMPAWLSAPAGGSVSARSP
jgi:hypothetical protein